MSILQAFAPLAIWAMRLGLVALLLMLNMDTVAQFSIKHISFYLSLMQILFATMLFFGGALAKTNWTMISALFLAILLTYDLVVSNANFNQAFVIDFVVLATALFFMSNGNKT